MPTGTRLGGAYVEVGAEVGKFGSKVVAALKKELAGAQREARAGGRAIGKEIADGILQGFRRRMPFLAAEIKALVRQIDATVKVRADTTDFHRMMAGLSKGFVITPRISGSAKKKAKDDMSQLAKDFIRIMEDIGGKTGGVIGGALVRVLGSATSELKTFTKFMKSSAGTAAVTAAQIELLYWALLAIIGAAQAAGRELLSLGKLSLLLPGMVAAVAAIAAPIIVAFRGIGDGITNALDATIKNRDFNKAIANLSWAAQEVMWDVRRAKPFLQGLGRYAQDQLFKHLAGLIPRAVAHWGPTFEEGFGKIADTAGLLLAKLFEKVDTPRAVAFFDRLFQAADRILSFVGEGFSNLIVALGRVAEATIPIIERLGEGFGGALNEAADWLSEKAASGELTQWINDGLQTLGELRDLFKEVFLLMGVLFDEDEQKGESFLSVITRIVRDIREFAESKEGELVFRGIALAAGLAFWAIVGIVGAVGLVVAALGTLAGAIDRIIEKIKAWAHSSNSAAKALRSLLGAANALSGVSISGAVSGAAKAAQSVAGAKSKLIHFAEGGIITRHQIAEVGEGNRPEVVIPLTNPQRARQLTAQSGLDRIIGSATPNISVAVYLGNHQFDSHVTRITTATINRAANNAVTRGLATAPA